MGKVCGGETLAKRSSVIQLIDRLLIDPNSIMERPIYFIFADISIGNLRSSYKKIISRTLRNCNELMANAVPEINVKSLLMMFPWKSFEVVVTILMNRSAAYGCQSECGLAISVILLNSKKHLIASKRLA